LIDRQDEFLYFTEINRSGFGVSYKLSSSEGGFYVEVDAVFLGQDLLVTCTGGDKPHIGAVAVAHTRTAHDEPDKIMASANIICLSGHREDELARAAALKLCRDLGCTVTVVAGMHWHHIDREGIDQVVANVERLIERLQEVLAVSGSKEDA
jgi:hypothetical protein